MAQLTLTEKTVMSNIILFQQRMSTAMKVLANTYKDVTLTLAADFNLRNKKRKEFAKQVLAATPTLGSTTLLSSSTLNIKAYVDYFLVQYTDVSPDIDTNPSSPTFGQLNDSPLTVHAGAIETFDYFAGVKAGDDLILVSFD